MGFNALTLFGGHHEEHRPVKIEWWDVGVVICLERGADFAYGPADANAFPKTHNISAHLNPKMVFTFPVPDDLG